MINPAPKQKFITSIIYMEAGLSWLYIHFAVKCTFLRPCVGIHSKAELSKTNDKHKLTYKLHDYLMFLTLTKYSNRISSSGSSRKIVVGNGCLLSERKMRCM